MANASQIINALNGVTFQEGSLGDASTTGVGVGGAAVLNGAGGKTDVVTTGAGATTSNNVNVAYINHFDGNGLDAPGAAGKVTDAHYAYTAGDATHFATFGYIEFSDSSVPGQKYYIHGFSSDQLLLSTNASLTVNQVNGLSGTGQDAHYFEVLSTQDLGQGGVSPNYPGGGPKIYHSYASKTSHANGNTYAFSNYKEDIQSYTDTAGINHGVVYSYVYTIYNGNVYSGGGLYTTGLQPGRGNPGYTSPSHAATFDGNINPISFPLTFTNDATKFDITSIPCFAEGTRVLTARGEVRVEDLAEGDEVVTASGGLRPAIWIGSRRIAPRAHPRPWEVAPVRVRAGAFGEEAPARDLLLSPGHAVFVDGVLVPAGHLVNGATIVQEEVESIRYFHVELDAHDVLLAEGLACESYLDDGNREVFANGAAHTALYGRLDPQDRETACASVLRDWDSDGQALAAIQARLIVRAEALGWVRSAEPELRLEVDGAALAPIHAANGRAWFQLPAGDQVRLLSNAGRPMDLIPGFRDGRRLGAAVSEVRVDGVALDLAGEAFGRGFCEVERHGEVAWRWTDGEAVLALSGPALVEVALHMAALHWRRPAAQPLRLVAG